MTQPKISIVVAIYNQEPYLRKSLSSIRDNDFYDYEVLLVNDGSTDRSSEICLEYCESDPRFKYFEKPNGGIASTRQFGLEHASGDYIIHVDPDDWVEPTYLSELYRKAEESGADVVICDYVKEYADESVVIDNAKLNNASIGELKLALAGETLWGVCWNKLVRRSVITQNNLQFEKEINFQEDKLFTSRVFKYTDKVVFLTSRRPLYHYNQLNPQSALAKFGFKQLLQAWHVKHLILSAEKDKAFIPKLKESLASLTSVRHLILSKEIPLSTCNDLLMPFKGAIRKKVFMSKDGLKVKLIALMATFSVTARPIRYLYKTLKK